MKDLLEKISSYNIFNYLLPGVIFSYLATNFSKLNLIQDDIVVGVFVYYFIGLIISRIGSLVFEPVLIFALQIKFAPYKEYIAAVKSDPKIEVLSEVNNMYRTLFSMLCCILFLLALNETPVTTLITCKYLYYISVAFLILIFGFSYKKQTNYIKNRVDNSK